MKNFILIITALLIIFALTGCGDKEMGIFYSIEQERKVEDNEIPNESSPGNMVVYEDKYYAATGDIYYVDTVDNFEFHESGSSAGEWTRDESYDYENKMCRYIGLIGTGSDPALYGVFFNKNSTSTSPRLYMKNGDDWEKTTATEDMNIDKIIGSEITGTDYALLLTYTIDDYEREYSVYSFDGTAVPHLLIDGLTQTSYFDAAKDSGDVVWVLCGSNVYYIASASLNSGSLVADEQDFSGDSLRGIYYSDVFSGLFLSVSDGTIYHLADGSGTWTTLEDEPSGTPGDFMDFEMLDGTNMLLIGTTSGYYELIESNGIDSDFEDPSETAETSTYNTTDLSSALVHSFFNYTITDSDGYDQLILFALTNNNGLWSNGLYEGGDERVWDSE